MPVIVAVPSKGLVAMRRNDDQMARPTSTAIWLCWAQGLYYFVTGLWPLISVESFQRVTGPKSDHLIADTPTEADHWMLNTISGLIIVISLVLLTAAWRRRPSLEVGLLGALSAAALATIDIVYVSRGTIRSIYLADAAIEAGIIAAWVWIAWSRTRREASGPSSGNVT
jgi:hypothetical protein